MIWFDSRMEKRYLCTVGLPGTGMFSGGFSSVQKAKHCIGQTVMERRGKAKAWEKTWIK